MELEGVRAWVEEPILGNIKTYCSTVGDKDAMAWLGFPRVVVFQLDRLFLPLKLCHREKSFSFVGPAATALYHVFGSLQGKHFPAQRTQYMLKSALCCGDRVARYADNRNSSWCCRAWAWVTWCSVARMM